MLDVMYRITKDESGVILVCLECSHIERVNEFDGGVGSRRTQAAQAMLKHTHYQHSRKPIARPMSRLMEREHSS